MNSFGIPIAVDKATFCLDVCGQLNLRELILVNTWIETWLHCIWAFQCSTAFDLDAPGIIQSCLKQP